MFQHVMLATRSRMPRSVVLLLAGLIATGLVVARVPADARAADWQPTGLAEPTYGLGAPPSGAFFASTKTGFRRSDDGGASWRPVPLPPGYDGDPRSVPGFAVDPNNHDRIFATGSLTLDGGATWTPFENWPFRPDQNHRLRISAADSNLLYVAATAAGTGDEMGTDRVRMLRSRDGGATWDRFLTLTSADFRPGSAMAIPIFDPHPSNPNILFHSVGGFRGSGNQSVLRRSVNQGATAKEVLFEAVHYPSGLVGGRGAASNRFYVVLRSEERTQYLYRSDDDGETWSRLEGFETEPNVSVRLSIDPAGPDRVFAALGGAGIRLSEDGGLSWTDLGLADQAVHDLALGIDGANLYAATDAGVLRLPLR